MKLITEDVVAVLSALSLEALSTFSHLMEVLSRLKDDIADFKTALQAVTHLSAGGLVERSLPQSRAKAVHKMLIIQLRSLLNTSLKHHGLRWREVEPYVRAMKIAEVCEIIDLNAHMRFDRLRHAVGPKVREPLLDRLERKLRLGRHACVSAERSLSVSKAHELRWMDLIEEPGQDSGDPSASSGTWGVAVIETADGAVRRRAVQQRLRCAITLSSAVDPKADRLTVKIIPDKRTTAQSFQVVVEAQNHAVVQEVLDELMSPVPMSDLQATVVET